MYGVTAFQVGPMPPNAAEAIRAAREHERLRLHNDPDAKRLAALDAEDDVFFIVPVTAKTVKEGQPSC